MLEETYLYSVNPRRPIMLSDGTPIRVPKSVYLSKEELKTILPNAIVYRRFATGNVKVNTGNIDEVHVLDQTSETIAKVHEAKVEEMSKHVGTVTISEPATPVVENKKEVVEEISSEEKVEETKESTAEVKESDNEISEAANSVVEDKEAEKNVDNNSKNQQKNNNNYNKKKN